MTHVKRILVCRGGALGDFVVTLPVLQGLRRAWPSAQLDLLAYPRHAVLAQAAGLADEVRSLDDAGLAEWFGAAGAGLTTRESAFIDRYDVLVCFLHDPDGHVEANLRRVAGPRMVFHSPLVTGAHAVDHFLAVLPRLGWAAGRAVPSLALPGRVLERGRAMVAPRQRPVAVLHPGSGSAIKNWPLVKFRELAGRLALRHGFEPVFLLGEADARLACQLDGAYPVLRELPVLEAAAVLAAGAVYVGNDSGVTHLAAAVGTPVVALFGPSDPALWAPRGPAVRLVRAAPPDTTGLAAVTVDAVEEAVGQVVARTRA